MSMTKIKATFFVATNGNDAWSGKSAEPNAAKTDGPFATLTRARNAVRKLKEEGDPKEAITVMVRSGKYFLEDTLVLSKADSGTQDCPVSYTAYPDEKPVLSGGRKVTGWKPYKDKILQCELPSAEAGKLKFRQLFFNGQRQMRSRWPKRNSDNPLYDGWVFTEGAAAEHSFVAFKYPAGTFNKKWAKPEQAEVFMLLHWGVTNILPIESVDDKNGAMVLADGVKDFDVAPCFIPTPFDCADKRSHYRFYVENILEALDQPGEWCLDAEDGMLYFWPPESIESAEVTVPILSSLIDLRGASYINISGFTFTETTSGDNMHREGYEGAGAMFPVPGRRYCGETLHLRLAEHCCIEKNQFYAIGGNGIYLEDYNARNIIRNNDISYGGACGVVLIGSEYFNHGVPHHPVYNQIEDNHIHHCGVFDKYVAGIFLGLSDGNVIGHNYIHHMPHHGINLGNSGFGRNIVEYNEIRHTCLETFDSAAINNWMEDTDGHCLPQVSRAGHIIRHNFVADTRGCKADENRNLIPDDNWATLGIYLDNFSSNCFVYGNIIVRSGACGIMVNGGKNNIIENNIVVGGRFFLRCYPPGRSWAPQMNDFMTGNRVCRNVFYGSDPDIDLYRLYVWTDRVLASSDHNLFFNTTGKGYAMAMEDARPESDHGPDCQMIPFAQWQRNGYDRHSVIGDPLFVDATQDDYRLKPESPALRLGFEPIDTAQIGLRKTSE